MVSWFGTPAWWPSSTSTTATTSNSVYWAQSTAATNVTPTILGSLFFNNGLNGGTATAYTNATGTAGYWGDATDQQYQALHMANQQHAMQQALMASQQADHYERSLTGNGWHRVYNRLFTPALIAHQDEARRDEALYRRALAEHDDQEAARLLRIVEAHARSAEERRRLIDQQRQQQDETRQRLIAAQDRARELLHEHLTPAQRETVEGNGWFLVEGGKSKTKYRIGTRGGAAGNIEVLSPVDQRKVTHRLCCHAQSHIPLGDQWLSQKIMLELAEDDFLRIANRHAA